MARAQTKVKVVYVASNSIYESPNANAYQKPLIIGSSFGTILLTSRGHYIPREIRKVLKVVRIGCSSLPWPANIFDFWLHTIIAISRLARRGKLSGVICYLDMAGLLIGISACLLCKLPLIFLCWDHPYPIEASSRGIWMSVRRAIRRTVVRIGLKRCTAILCNIDPDVIRDLAPPELRIAVFPNGAECNPSYSYSREIATNSIVVTSDVTIEKGIEWLIEAFAKVKNEVPDATLTIIGKINAAFLPTVFKFVRDYCLEGSLHLTGWLPHELAMSALSKATLCVFSYPPLPRYYYNYPLKVVEYLSLGKPVFGFKTQGASRYIVDDYNGLLVPPGDTSQLAAGIIRALKDPKRRNYLAANASQTSRRFRLSSGNKNFVDTIQTVLQIHKKRLGL